MFDDVWFSVLAFWRWRADGLTPWCWRTGVFFILWVAAAARRIAHGNHVATGSGKVSTVGIFDVVNAAAARIVEFASIGIKNIVPFCLFLFGRSDYCRRCGASILPTGESPAMMSRPPNASPIWEFPALPAPRRSCRSFWNGLLKSRICLR